MKASISKNTIALTTQTSGLQLTPLTLGQAIAITGSLPTRLQPGDLRRKDNPILRMKLNGTGVRRTTTVAELCTTACTNVTKHMNMTRGKKTLTRRRLMERLSKLIQALLQIPPKTLMQRNWHCVNHYAQQCALRLVYPQKYLIAYGPTRVGSRETSRSEPRVGYHNDYCLCNFLCDTSGSNDLSYSFPNLNTLSIPDQRDDKM